jgi:DNA-binding CsgD family transcriptional regulator
VLSAIAIVPSAPVMVPELASGAAAELADLREAVFAAASSLPARWVAIGVGPADDFVGPERVGTFAGYGVDVRITLSPRTGVDPTPLTSREHAIASFVAEGLSNREIAQRLVISARTVEGHLYRISKRIELNSQHVELPLCALIAGWVRGQAGPEARAEVRVYADEHDVDAALARGRRLRAEIDQAADPVGVLIVADGAHTLTPPAPGGYDPDSIPVQAALDDALAGGDAAALTRLPDTIVGRVAYQVLAGLTGVSSSSSRPGRAPRSATELYRGAPYGVGYFVGVWQP